MCSSAHVRSTARGASSYDANALADDAAALLDALGEPEAAVVGTDTGAPPAFMLATRRPDRVRRLVLMESLIGLLPGAEDFLKAGPPWWFGFHAVPDLPETVLVGHERVYVDFFLTTLPRRAAGGGRASYLPAMPPLPVVFVGGASGAWRVERVARGRAALVRAHGDGLHLDEKLGTKEAGNLHE